jgi:hypothetical protein
LAKWLSQWEVATAHANLEVGLTLKILRAVVYLYKCGVFIFVGETRQSLAGRDRQRFFREWFDVVKL